MAIEIESEKLKSIAEYREIGMVCFLNKATGELEYYPDELEESGYEEEWVDVTSKIESNPDEYLAIEKMSNHEVFKLMENFTAEIDHKLTQNKFIDAISGKKPFAQFKNMLANYPSLRDQWFAFKSDRYIEFVKNQIEIHNTLNDPVKEFCVRLEYYLSNVFRNSADKKISVLWCDGIIVLDNPLLTETVIETKKIKTQAIIGQMGQTKQEKYEMIIKLGEEAIKKFADDLSMADCLPVEDELNWLSVDVDQKKIELQLN